MGRGSAHLVARNWLRSRTGTAPPPLEVGRFVGSGVSSLTLTRTSPANRWRCTSGACPARSDQRRVPGLCVEGRSEVVRGGGVGLLLVLRRGSRRVVRSSPTGGAAAGPDDRRPDVGLRMPPSPTS